MKVTVCRRAHFNAAHRLHNPAWDEKKNYDAFGICSRPNYHGHNYDLIVKVTGDIDPETGFVMDMNHLKRIIDKYIVKRFDHYNLNIDLKEFKNLNPTTENIAVIIYNILRAKISNKLDISIVLYETERNFVEYSGE